MGNGALAIGPKLPRPSSTLPQPTSVKSVGGKKLLACELLHSRMAHPMLAASIYGGAFGPPPGRAANWAERSMSFTPRAPERGGDVASSHKRKRQVMINFHRPIAGSFTVGILVMCVLLAISAPASARGGGGGG